MTTTVSKDLAALEKMTISELHDRYAELFGERIQSRHRIYLVRRIAWRIQANAEGGLSERARVRAAQLANPTDVRRTPPKWATLGEAPKDAKKVALAATADPRLPPAGAAIVRDYRGRTVRVVVLADGFEFEGERYRSLSAIAKAVTGSHVNGFRFFNLEGRR